MIKGQVIRKGTMTVDGEQLTGLFIECEREELTDNKLDLYTIVEVVERMEKNDALGKTGNIRPAQKNA